MPIWKEPRDTLPLWHEKVEKAKRNGLRKTVYAVNGDQYVGEWKDDKKSGKGTQLWKNTGGLYDGEWLADRRCGFGTYSVPTPDGSYRKQYSGSWRNDKRHDMGTHYYSETEYYEGNWDNDKRSGWGRMVYHNGSAYEGEWLNDQPSGNGMLRLSNGNWFEGDWANGMKNGHGKFYYLDKGQVFEGLWVDNLLRCGQLLDMDRENAPKGTPYPLPSLQLANVDVVLTEAERHALHTTDAKHCIEYKS